MFEPTEREVDRDVHDSIDMFTRAMVPGTVELAPRTPQKLLVALDGSSQDETALAIAAGLKKQFSSAVCVMDARDSADSNELAETAARKYGATVLPKGTGDAFDQILEAVKQHNSSLVIVPCPFGRNIDNVGDDSTGTVIDVLLSRCPVPLLVVRQPWSPAEPPFQRVILSFAAENDAAPRAAEWALALTPKGGHLQLMLVVDEEAVENMRALLQNLDKQMDIDRQKFGEALQKSFIPLHRALQQATRSTGTPYELAVRQEGHLPAEELTRDPRHPLLVLGLERADHLSQGYVHDRIRYSANAVLVVPGP